MAVDAAPTTTFEMIQAQLLFGFSKTVFDRPASEGDAQDLAQRPTVTSRNTIGQEVFHFAGQYVASHDQRTLLTHKRTGMRLSPAGLPANLPYLFAMMCVLDAISLRILFAKRGRVLRQVLHFAGMLISLA